MNEVIFTVKYDLNGQVWALIFSSIANILWMLVFIPQFYKNYKNKNVEAISLLLVLCLLLGDILSIISSIAKSLNYVIIFTSIYHVFLDIIIILQILYYRIYSCAYQELSLFPDSENERNNLIFKCLSLSELIFIITSFLSVSSFIITLFVLQNLSYFILLSNCIAWFSTLIFMFARIPQIVLNFKRKSTQGLSFFSFVLINVANIFFLLSILIILLDVPLEFHLSYILSNIQWISGSILTTIFDAIIFYQFHVYRE